MLQLQVIVFRGTFGEAYLVTVRRTSNGRCWPSAPSRAQAGTSKGESKDAEIVSLEARLADLERVVGQPDINVEGGVR